MKKVIILLILSAFAMSMAAQDTLKKTTSKSRFEFKKNELGFNIAPIAGVLINAGRGGNGGTTRFSLSYKHYLNEHSGLRISLVGDLIQDDQYNFWGDKGRVIFILKNDTTLMKQQSLSSSYWSPHLNLGYERVFGSRERLKWFYGADLTLGYSIKKVDMVTTFMDKDTTGGQQGWIETGAIDEFLLRTKIKTMSIGVSPFFGAKYVLSRHFSISAQVGFDASYRDQQISEVGINGSTHMHVSTFDFTMDTGILNDISLIYKF